MAISEGNRKAHYTGRHMSHSIKADQLASDTNRSRSLGYSYQKSGKCFTKYLKLPKAEKYPIEIFSYTSLCFASLAVKYPQFKNQFLVLSKLKNLVSEFEGLKWISLCLDRSNGRQIPRIRLDFHCREELFEKAQKTIDAILEN